MGRPLFSSVDRSPVVVAPETGEHIHYEKWTHGAFDPDSDEFFEDAVYEAFLEPEDTIDVNSAERMSTSTVAAENVAPDAEEPLWEIVIHRNRNGNNRVDLVPSDSRRQRASGGDSPTLSTTNSAPSSPTQSRVHTSDITPIPLRSSAVRGQGRPITPPFGSPSWAMLEPSPPPNVTPRLYSWSSAHASPPSRQPAARMRPTVGPPRRPFY
ncbi:hypothetical protein EW146_g5216 [Bondarzewia mesenterica]|uniref:Uncharacterized protein n=1 Tax=Bondarzewia mesenterica TaxID=1095465 RepID=A0A4S4LS69_9AGAM|nr:hypothetical protein EW146_g5216 [Bondarzewia mesenterica]